MARHYIRDAQGRVEKILNDIEYAEYKKKRNRNGCIAIIIFLIIMLIAGVCGKGNGDSTKGSSSSQSTINNDASSASSDNTYNTDHSSPSSSVNEISSGSDTITTEEPIVTEMVTTTIQPEELHDEQESIEILIEEPEETEID